MDEKVFAAILETKSLPELLSYITVNPALKFFQEGFIKFGHASFRIDLKLLANWFLYRAEIVSSEKVAAELHQFISSSVIPGNDVLAISGISVHQEIKFTSDISLIPYAQLPDSRAKSSFNPYSLSNDNNGYLKLSGLNPLISSLPPTVALISKNPSQPKFVSQPSSIKENGWISKEQDLIDLCSCLTLIGPSSPMLLASWWEPDSYVPYSRIYGFGASPKIFDLINRKTYSWTDENIQEALVLAQNYLKLKSEEKEKLLVPLERLNKMGCRINLVDQAIELGIAVEAVFLCDSEKNELSYRIQQRAAWFLGKDCEDRKKISKLFKDLYTCRSNAVHRGKISRRDIVETISEGAKQTAEAIKKIIMDGWPDWETLILG